MKKTRSGVNWLGRTLIHGPYTTLVTNPKDFKKAYDYLTGHKWVEGSDGEWCRPGCANVRRLAAEGEYHDTMLVSVNMPDDTVLDVLAALAHEATHIKQTFMETIGEKHPSDEFEAYVVQSIFFELASEYRRQFPKARA